MRSIPPGKVVTYGMAAEGVEEVRFTARMAGSAMRVAPSDVPWHRVVGAGGWLSIGKRSTELMLLQRELLEREGVQFAGLARNRVDLKKYLWAPFADPE